MAELIGWADPDKLPTDWADAPESEELAENLQASFEVLEGYAPPLAEGAEIPARYVKAQWLYARHLWARSRAGNRDSIGADGFAISTWPLVIEARSLLRPKQSPFKGLF